VKFILSLTVPAAVIMGCHLLFLSVAATVIMGCHLLFLTVPAAVIMGCQLSNRFNGMPRVAAVLMMMELCHSNTYTVNIS
ncbi:MAG: hypothetical protein F6J98_43040, partial [Moorea sp. SIO4G2]|nr:hypothetical protein [Moorena sp. SIO4G2]